MSGALSAVPPQRGGSLPGPPAEAKLRLVEFLLGSEDPRACAERALEWLGVHGGAKQAICAQVDQASERLVITAGFGLSPAGIEPMSIDLEAREHPLVVALSAAHPVAVTVSDEATLESLQLGGPAVAVAFQGLVGEERRPGGVLLASPASPETARVLEWLAEVLGHRLVRLLWYRQLTRDRTLLFGIVNAVPDPVILTDSEGRLIIANSRAESLFASRSEQSEGRRRAVELNNMLFSAALGQSALKDAAPDRRELLLVDPVEGSDLLFELLSTLAGDSREGMGIVSVLRNVSDLQRATEEIEANYVRQRVAESQARAERDRLDLIIDSVADPIVVTDPSGNIQMMNAPADRLFTEAAGATADEHQRVRANDANFTSFVSNVFFGLSELRYRGGINLVDVKTGAPVPVEAVSGQILSEQHGELTAVVTILHDRTEALERERLYEELKRASGELERKVREATAELVRQNELLRRQAVQLEQASALKSQFLANMSHEFRTPLNAILGYTSMLLKGVLGPLDDEQAEGLARVDSNGRHLLGIINDILDISRIEAGRMPLRLSEFGLPELVGEVLAEVEPIVAQASVHIEATVDQRLPALQSDRQKVKQIVLNLLTNAVKFTPSGTITLSARYDPRVREVAVTVADTGIGIAAEDHERIFEDFQQADSSPTRTHGGAGLGLSICRRLATMLGGKIQLESAPGIGSTFTVVLPRRKKGRR
ncbi:MAG TPA: ATP-binding protein [Candidatus Nitrosocosmicus sp.]|nr:ATP-binding protein [Candidatus Nitrosocosmicus sp.]